MSRFRPRCLAWLGLFTLLAATLPSALAGESARRVALVVGVARYQHAPALANPVHDAKAMEALLKRLGFEVETVADPTLGDLQAAIRRFGRRSVGADVSLFHYSGHALEVGGRNWLLPATFNTSVEREMPFEAVDLATVLDQATSAARVSLVFLDACRDNPFTPRLASSHRGLTPQGLAEIAAPASGSLIAFATAPGEVAADGSGADSPFTTALLHRLEEPGVEIKTLMGRVIEDVAKATDDRQRPWMTFTLRGDFYLNTHGPAAPAPAAPVDAELLFWQSVMTSKDASDYAAYLEKFPNGVFARLAEKRRAELSAPASGKAPGVIDSDSLAAQFVARRNTPAQAAFNAGYYLSRPDHRAVAASDGYYVMRTARAEVEEAEQLALEACEILGHAPCGVLAADGNWVATAPRPMPRARYDGLFDPALIPIVDDEVRERPDVQEYRVGSGPKAAALLPTVGVFTVARAASQRESEAAALAQCNGDPARTAMSGGCYLYAAGDQVVLPQRLTAPKTP